VVQKVLVATDQSDSATKAVQWAADMAERFQAELIADAPPEVAPTEPGSR
jgi:nucleotide-binding universal stress UspA family protein